MAKRRMFSLNVVEDDVFLDMPLTSQALYFHLGMQADDDGFVTPKRVMRMIGASEDDLKILIAKRYILVFESGVAVVKAWKVNNYIQNDRHQKTTYQHEFEQLTTNEWGAYTEIAKISHVEQISTSDIKELQQKSSNKQGSETKRKQSVSKTDTQVRLGKVRLEANTNVLAQPPAAFGDPKINALFEFWERETKLPIKVRIRSNRRDAKILLNMYGEDRLKQLITGVSMAMNDRYAPSISDFTQLKNKVNDLLIWGNKRKRGVKIV